MDVLEAYLTAARLDQLSAELRARALVSATLARSLTWNSLAGLAFHTRADALYRHLAGLVGALDATAQALRALARTP